MIRHLGDVAGLEPLEKIARDLGVEISATGELARRAYTHELLTPSEDAPDLFELTPFTTGIELVHSGGAEASDAIMRAIQRELTLPECFGWTLRSAEEHARDQRLRSYGPVVPVHGVRLSTREGFVDPMNARGDIQSNSYRFVRNPLYHESPKFRANRDLEVLGAIAFLSTVLDAEITVPEGDAALASVQDVFREARSPETVGRLQESASLRGALHRGVREARVTARTVRGRELIDRSGLASFLAYLDGDGDTPVPLAIRPAATRARVRENAESDGATRVRFLDDLEMDEMHALTVSDRIRGDVARLPQHVELLAPDAVSAGAAGQVLQVIASESSLADGIELLRLSRWITVMPGSPRTRWRDADEPNEMIHLAYVESGASGPPGTAPADEDVSVLVPLRSDDDRNEVLVAAPLAICTSRPYETPNGSYARLVMLRLACGSAIDRIAATSERATRVAFMVATRRIEEVPLDELMSVPVTSSGEEEMPGKSLYMRPIELKKGKSDPYPNPREEPTA
jgi:hypothetical protein